MRLAVEDYTDDLRILFIDELPPTRRAQLETHGGLYGRDSMPPDICDFIRQLSAGGPGWICKCGQHVDPASLIWKSRVRERQTAAPL